MTLLEAIVLGIVQGLTEFLPISSTAHLRIIPALVGWDDPGAPFTAVSQIGTLIAVLLYYRAEVLSISREWLLSVRHASPMRSKQSGMGWLILLATVPIVIAGLAFKDLIENEFRSLYVIAGSLIVLALILAAAEKVSRFDRSIGDLRWHDVILIGCAQAVALIPGSSRSGTTITAALFLHIKRTDAASFSFLLSIPAVGLSGLYQLYKLRADLLGDFGVAMMVTIVVSGVVGYAAIAFLISFLRTHSTFAFIWYRIVLGGAILLLLQFNVLSP